MTVPFCKTRKKSVSDTLPPSPNSSLEMQTPTSYIAVIHCSFSLCNENRPGISCIPGTQAAVSGEENYEYKKGPSVGPSSIFTDADSEGKNALVLPRRSKKEREKRFNEYMDGCFPHDPPSIHPVFICTD
mmetsp:Transcript_23608/g.46385  ORF Transcript_23608/g.46385 Transcript_23608/m.46385 type:complete len:130 (-) Transcript_23608:2218-2607(-)